MNQTYKDISLRASLFHEFSPRSGGDSGENLISDTSTYWQTEINLELPDFSNK